MRRICIFYRLLQDTRDRDIGTTRGLGVDEDMALVVTDLYARPTGKVMFSILNCSLDLLVTRMISL